MKFTTQWHHAPPHWIEEKGVYFVTGSTLYKEHFFKSIQSRNILLGTFFGVCVESGWKLHAWAFFSNHYHFIAEPTTNPKTLSPMLSKLHMQSAKWINEKDRTPGRKVWHTFWDKMITFERSYWPRLRYVHENPARHGLVNDPKDYPWCSAAWFAEKAPSARQRKMNSFKTDKLKIYDEFEPI